MAIDPKHKINLQGKDYVLYAGVLAEAHARGLSLVSTDLLQIPTEENGMTAIVRAIVTLKTPEGEITFTGIGDASPKNVNPRIATALIRMAETRAKGRAMRDAIGEGDVLAEEMVPDEEEALKAVVMPSKAKPAKYSPEADQAIEASVARGRARMADKPAPGFEEEYKTDKATFRRERLIEGLLALLAEANEKGLPTGPEVTIESARDLPNAKLYAEGLSLKKRLSAYDAMGGNAVAESPGNMQAMQVGA